MNSRVSAIARLLFIDLLGSIAWFPVWWYTTGLAMVAGKAMTALRYRSQAYAFRIWIRNFFVPMYGQYDLGGRAVSVFMRFVVLVGRAIAITVEAIIYLAGLVLWGVLPPLTIVLIVMNLVGGFTVN